MQGRCLNPCISLTPLCLNLPAGARGGQSLSWNYGPSWGSGEAVGSLTWYTKTLFSAGTAHHREDGPGDSGLPGRVRGHGPETPFLQGITHPTQVLPRSCRALPKALLQLARPQGELGSEQTSEANVVPRNAGCSLALGAFSARPP